MKRTAICWLAALAVVSSAAMADTVYLANGGKVAGKLVHLSLKIGPLERVFGRDQVKSIRCSKDSKEECEVLASDGTKYVGRIASVAIRCVAGELKFSGKSVEFVELGTVPVRKPRPEKKPVPKPADDLLLDPAPDAAKPAKKELSPEQKAKIRALLKTLGELRDKSLEQAKGVSAKEHALFKEKYETKWLEVCADVKEKRKDYAKHATEHDVEQPRFNSGGLGIGLKRTTTVTSGRGSVALQDMNAAQTRKDRLARTIRETKAALKTRARLRRERIRGYSSAVERYLRAGKIVPEDAMKKIFEKALKAK